MRCSMVVPNLRLGSAINRCGTCSTASVESIARYKGKLENLLRCHPENETGERIHLKGKLMKRLKQKASCMSGWGMLCLYLPGPTSAGCIDFEHPCYNSWSQKCSCIVLPRCLSSHFLPELVGELSGNIHEGSLQAASTVHKRGCRDWPCRCSWNRSNEIDQSLRSEPTIFLFLLHSYK